MKFIDRLESKIGKYAVPNLMIYLIALYIVGFIIDIVKPDFYIQYLSLNMYEILRGQVWRLVTFLCYPPNSSFIWFLISILIYYSLGRSLESLWGKFRFNLYIFTGILGTVLAALLIYLIWGQVWILTADQLYLTMLLGMAATLPDVQFLLFFIIPIKAKWLGIFYGLMLVYEIVISIIGGSYPVALEIALSVINFIIFFIFIKKPVSTAKQKARAKVYEFKARPADETIIGTKKYRHKCCVCGITDIDAPDMQFRYCSKCDGAREYCEAHIQNHTHVTNN